MPNPMFPWNLRAPDSYQQCVWGTCGQDASDRYPLPLCQHHILFIWSFVDADIRESGKTGEDLQREASSRQATPAEEARYARRIKLNHPGYVYYLEVGGMIKIGYTKSPGQRGGQYPPSAVLLAIHPGTRLDERAAHKQFSAYLQAGREWFMDCKEIRDRVDEISAAEGKWRTAMRRRRPRGTQPMKSATPHMRHIVLWSPRPSVAKVDARALGPHT